MLKKNLTGLIFSLCLSTPAFAENYALLIGVGDYQGEKSDLDGPMHDVFALKDTLQQHWNFKPENINTLINYDASREGILNALTQIKNQATAQDQIFIYFSGHGTSMHDKDMDLPLPYSSGALVPQDFSGSGSKQKILDSLIIGWRDIKPVLLELDKTSAQSFIVFDACYSGNSVRGVFNSKEQLPTRNMDIVLADDYDDEEVINYRTIPSIKTEAYPYKNILFISAANVHEPALDISKKALYQWPTLDNRPHGAFTDALLRALSGQIKTDLNHDSQLNYSELYAAVKSFMKQRGYSHEPQVLPQLNEDHQLLRLRRVMGKKAIADTAPQTKTSLFSLHLDNDDPILLSRLKQLAQITITEQAADLNLQKRGNNYQLVNKSGDLIGTLTNPTIQTIIGRVQQEVWKEHFNRQLQQRASINIDFSLKNSLKGSTAIEGELIAFTLRSEQALHLLLLDVNSYGEVSILYPYRPHELQAIPANKLSYIPGENPHDLIKIQAPFGIDHLIAVGFAEPPPFLKEFMGKDTLSTQSELFNKLQDHLKTAKYGFQTLDLLTVPANKHSL